jgi:hypothetical protein
MFDFNRKPYHTVGDMEEGGSTGPEIKKFPCRFPAFREFSVDNPYSTASTHAIWLKICLQIRVWPWIGFLLGLRPPLAAWRQISLRLREMKNYVYYTAPQENVG